MGRGRKRKFNPDIPRHIGQDALTKGVYWADGRWYIIEPHPEGGPTRKRIIAYADARLSNLHAAREGRLVVPAWSAPCSTWSTRSSYPPSTATCLAAPAMTKIAMQRWPAATC